MKNRTFDNHNANNFSSSKLKIVSDTKTKHIKKSSRNKINIIKESVGRLSYHHTRYTTLEALDGIHAGEKFFITSKTEKTFKHVLAVIMSHYGFTDYEIKKDRKYKFYEWLEK